MSRDATVVWHVTPESNVESVEENGLRPAPCVMTWIGDERTPERVTEGVYVTRTRRAMEAYAASCLEDVRDGMGDRERFALFRAEVDASRLTSDPESDVGSGPDAWIHVDPIDDPELVTVGVLDG